MRFFLLFIAALVAVFAGIAAMQLTSSAPTATNTAATAQPAPTQSVSTVDVLVARVPIAPGTVLSPALFDKQPWPEHLVLEGFIVANTPAANVAGKVTRSAFQAREPLIASKLAASTDTGFLAASLPAGMRAITIATDAVNGVAGFVFPGDRVDVLFTHNIPQEMKAATGAVGDKGASDKAGFAEVLMSNIPVLAINLREGVAKEETANLGGVAGAVASAVSSVSPSSLTLQVSDLQAEKIRLAEKVGNLSFTLRSVNDRDNPSVPNPADLLSLTKLSMEETAPEEDTIQVTKGGDFGASAAASKLQRVQGGTK